MARGKLTRIEKRKRLDALFDKGVYVWFNATDRGDVVIRPKGSHEDDDFKIWVRPPSPFQREMVIREGQAARARSVVAARDPESKEWITIRGFVASLSDESLIQYVMDLDEADRLSEARRDVLKEKEWEDFNSLRDAMRQFEEAGSPENDPEWKPLLDRDVEFGEQIRVRGNELREAAREAMKLIPRNKLEQRAFEKRVDQAGTAEFVSKYEEWMLFYACRDDDDHGELYFEDLTDLRSQPEELQDALRNALAEFVTEAAEAKNLQAAASSSTSSEPPVEPETSESSTPGASSA